MKNSKHQSPRLRYNPDMRMIPSPSPRPSPQGRGRIVLQSSANPQVLFAPRAGLRVSLSPRERAGVRGNETAASTMASLILGSGAHDAQKLRVSLSPWAGVRGKGPVELQASSYLSGAAHGSFKSWLDLGASLVFGVWFLVL